MVQCAFPCPHCASFPSGHRVQRQTADADNRFELPFPVTHCGSCSLAWPLQYGLPYHLSLNVVHVSPAGNGSGVASWHVAAHKLQFTTPHSSLHLIDESGWGGTKEGGRGWREGQGGWREGKGKRERGGGAGREREREGGENTINAYMKMII